MKKLDYLGRKFTHPVYGEVEVIDQHPDWTGRTEFTIRFKNTGSEINVAPNNLRSLSFKDPFAPSIAGVGYFGDTAYEYGYSKKEYGRIYAIWTQMMNRCYDKNNKDYPYYGALGVTVCPRWHNFSNFFYDFIHMDNFKSWLESPKNSYHLDKDIKQMELPMECRIYSPDTCTLISTDENLAQMVKARFGDNDYLGVHFEDHSWQAFMNDNGHQVLRAKFNNPWSAAVFRECYAHYKYNKPMINDATKVPITMEAFSQAKSDRLFNKEPYPYKQMIELVDNTVPFDSSQYGYKNFFQSDNN